ncbi:MAG: glycosyltransferase [Muricauda sp.]|nr:MULTISPECIES: glycosyltransferase family 39 protein [unclassified Allomuricauda]MAU17667.1 glycosyltransferase [Allomuricauda sp.]|tara:strand:+ start:20298 stop:21797 length:1500 start_codon:yes stop_codon:yes gene_type:complete
MAKKLYTTVLKKINPLSYQNLDWKTVFFVLVIVAIFVRFPFFFRDYIDRDESTFIIMGQSWANGHLPYTQLWDLKPPITFLYFAIIIKIFGKSFIAIRLFGSIMVAITALFTYGIATKLTTKKVAFWVSVFCVFFQSLFGSLQGVMSEHISILFFAAGTYLLFLKENRSSFFGIGVLFGLSLMSKLNMVYPITFLGLYLLWDGYNKKQVIWRAKHLFWMTLGVVLVILLTILPYYFQNEIQLCRQSIVEAPLAYSGGKFHSPLNTLPFAIVILGLLLSSFIFKIIDWKDKKIQILTVVIVCILLSFVQAGKVNGHYLIQLYPFVLIPLGIAVAKLPAIQKKYHPLIIFLLILIPVESYLEYGNIISNKIKTGTFFNGEGIEVPTYITEHNLETENIFFTEYHIGYWVLGEEPPTKAATHPSNITREEMFPFMNNPRKTGMEEIQYIMEVVQPKTLVAREGKEIFDKKLVDYNAYIDSYLEEHYQLTATIGRGLIYQRLE